jgi:retron-type reverse transcriptase
MKRHKNLHPAIVDWRNLMQAWRKARKGKRYREAAASFARNLDQEMLSIHSDLVSGQYQPGGYRSFTVHDPKRRKISAAPFRDRVVHHALCNVIEPIYERKFIFDSYANRAGRGTHKALDRCTTFMRRYVYVLQCDIQQFFPAIDHAIMKSILSRTIACPPTMRLCEKIIDSGAGILNGEYDMLYFPGDDLFAATRPRGLPIGNLTSQFWANVYLNELDQFVKHCLRARGYVRYVDDFLLFANDKVSLHIWREEIIEFLGTLRLTLHENRTQPRHVSQGVTFLGFSVFKDHRRIKREKGIAYQRRLRHLLRGIARGEVEFTDLTHSLQSWIGHARHGDTWGLRSKMLSEIAL